MTGVKAMRAAPVLPSVDVAATLGWLERVFGCEIWTWDDPVSYGGAMFGDAEVHVWRTEDAALPKSSSCRIEVEDVRAVHAVAEAAGAVHPNGGLEAKPWGFLEFAALAPCGLLFVFVQNLDADLDIDPEA